MAPLCTWSGASGWKSRRWSWGRSPARSAGRSACSTSRTSRASVMPPALSKQRWSKHIGGGWNGPQRCARCKMEQSGFKGWSTTTEQTRSVSWTRAHAAEYVNEIAQAVQAAGGRLPATWLAGVLHRLKQQGPERVLRHLAWLAARYPNPTIQEKLTYLQKREAHMQYPMYQEAGWPIGSGSVESANKVVVEARLKGAGMRWERHNVNPMLVLRNAVCNRRWQETWQTSRAELRTLRTSQREADSHQRLTSACWTLAFWGVRVYRVSHPAVPAAPSPSAVVREEPPVRRLGSGYSWRKPFLRRPPSTLAGLEEVSAKK